MLHHYRRFWAPLAFMVLALPLVVGLVAPVDQTASTVEARVLAPAPEFPQGLSDWPSAPRQVDSYLRDHFGLRRTLLSAYAFVMSRDPFHSGKSWVAKGLNGWMFYRGDAMLQQSAGLVRRDDQVAEMVGLLATMQRTFAARDSRLLVASPPNSSTIYGEKLPLWARNRGLRTEYDVFLDDLAASNIPSLDLRQVLIAAKAQGSVYRKHGTHWTARGALAAFNAIVQADGHPDWTLDPASVLGPPTTIVGGDLPRLIGPDVDVTETDQLPILPPGDIELLGPQPFAPYVATRHLSGPTIMIIGDSFTEALFAPMLLQHAGRVVWVYQQSCRFDWKWVDQFHPDEVWWMPTERFLVCRHGNRPADLPPG